MYNFTILPNISWYTNPKADTRQRDRFISKSIDAFYHSNYHAGNTERRETAGTVENIITTLKNCFHNKTKNVLMQAENDLIHILRNDLPQILRQTRNTNLTVCVIPRAKSEKSYTPNQLFFKKAVSIAVSNLNGFTDGINYIIRHTSTRTSHLDRSGYGGDGDLPYPGITKATCSISKNVRGKNILLVDDLYTAGVNIDEDAIQALLDNETANVFFYSIGKTHRGKK